jgi:hypothetical protein
MDPSHQPTNLSSSSSSTSNSAAFLLQQLGEYGLLQIPQQQPPHPPQQQFQLITSQQQQQQQQQFPMASTMTATMPATTNTSSIIPRQYTDRERQIKRRTKTGMKIFRNVR